MDSGGTPNYVRTFHYTKRCCQVRLISLIYWASTSIFVFSAILARFSLYLELLGLVMLISFSEPHFFATENRYPSCAMYQPPELLFYRSMKLEGRRIVVTYQNLSKDECVNGDKTLC